MKTVFNKSIALHQQRGSALAVGLVILLIMTIIGVTGMQTTTMEEKMAGNMRDRNLAFQAAEAALRTGEGYLQNSSILPTFNNTNGVYQARDMAPNQWYKDNDTWWMTSANVRSFNTSTFASVAPGTAYILEELAEVAEGFQNLEAGTPRSFNFYRVTARGVGGTTNAVVIVQSVFRR